MDSRVFSDEGEFKKKKKRDITHKQQALLNDSEYQPFFFSKGYFNDPAKTAEAITKDGWMKTGDMAVIDEQGVVLGEIEKEET